MKSKISWQDALSSLRSEMDESVDEQVVESREEKKTASSDNLAIFYERKGRGGKEATIITGFTCDDDILLEVASKLKKTLGCGGSARGGEILVQGDRRKQLPQLLMAMGYKVKV